MNIPTEHNYEGLGIVPEIAVDTFELTYKEGDLVIMCSDGLNSMVSDG